MPIAPPPSGAILSSWCIIATMMQTKNVWSIQKYFIDKKLNSLFILVIEFSGKLGEWAYWSVAEYYLVNSRYLHVRHGVAMAAYVQLTSRSQAKISQQRIFRPIPSSVCSRTCAALVDFRPGLSLDSCQATIFQLTSSLVGMVGGPYMKMPAINQVIFIKHVLALAAYRSCRIWRWEKMSWIHYLLSDHYRTQCRRPISNAGHSVQIEILGDTWQPPICHWQNVR